MKKRIVISVGLFLVVLSFAFIYSKNVLKEKAAKEYELQIMYKWQNKAFSLGKNDNDRMSYIGSDKLDLKFLFISLYRYSVDEPDSDLTMQEVIDYLSTEYADDGTLMIYSRPESISNYIEWWSTKDGAHKVTLFNADIAGYLGKNGYDYHYEKYSIEELQKILPKVWSYVNE